MSVLSIGAQHPYCTARCQNLSPSSVATAMVFPDRNAIMCLSELSLTTKDGCIDIDENCRTSMRGLFAIGDVTGEPMLAHRAMAQAEFVAKQLAGQSVVWDKQCIPAVCFTDPEIVTAGLTKEQAVAAGLDVDVSLIPYRANGRSILSVGERLHA